MEVDRISGTHATITISRSELVYLNNAINETLNALGDSEHHIRTGETRERARALLEEIGAIYDKMASHK